MTREEAKELLPIIQAFTEGKTIQVRINNDSSWTDLLDTKLEISNLYEYRIKSEPKYRPFKTQEECWEEMKKHKPFGWIKGDVTSEYKQIIRVFEDKTKLNFNISYNGRDYSSETMLINYTFIDGTPFGIKEE